MKRRKGHRGRDIDNAEEREEKKGRGMVITAYKMGEGSKDTAKPS